MQLNCVSDLTPRHKHIWNEGQFCLDRINTSVGHCQMLFKLNDTNLYEYSRGNFFLGHPLGKALLSHRYVTRALAGTHGFQHQLISTSSPKFEAAVNTNLMTEELKWSLVQRIAIWVIVKSHWRI